MADESCAGAAGAGVLIMRLSSRSAHSEPLTESLKPLQTIARKNTHTHMFLGVDG